MALPPPERDLVHRRLRHQVSESLGIRIGPEQASKIGERIWNLERVYNLRAGLTKKDDALPPRMLGEPLGEGMSAGHGVPLDPMLADYYRLRGWDAEGRPTSEKLAALRV